LLRRYLEQRRDMGERELALDSLDVEAALALIGNAKRQAPSGTSAIKDHGAVATPRDRVPAPMADADWRTALATSGLGPGRTVPPPAVEAPVKAQQPLPTPQPEAMQLPPPLAPKPEDKRFAFLPPADATPTDAPDGLVVGQAGGSALEGDVAMARSIDELAQLVAACAACGLGATKHRDVVGEGDPHADFVVVGEAPGEQEDLSGRPFVGASGQLLTKILAAINLPREQVYICNVIKHRPPGNRNPTPAEVSACSPFLLRQLELVKPKVILAVGTFAAQTLLRTKEPIGKLRGRVHRYYGVPLVVTYHPAALLRNPSWKRPTWDDVQLARRILDRAPRA
jgi:DNA polymerase